MPASRFFRLAYFLSLTAFPLLLNEPKSLGGALSDGNAEEEKLPPKLVDANEDESEEEPKLEGSNEFANELTCDPLNNGAPKVGALLAEETVVEAEELCPAVKSKLNEGALCAVSTPNEKEGIFFAGASSSTSFLLFCLDPEA